MKAAGGGGSVGVMGGLRSGRVVRCFIHSSSELLFSRE